MSDVRADVEFELAAYLYEIAPREVPDDWHAIAAAAALDFLLGQDPEGSRQDPDAPLLAYHNWPSNAAMIADIAARFDYLDGHVADVTFGYGNFWTEWKPATFTASDLDPAKSPIGHSIDFTATGFDEASFDSVVLDAPYKLSGTSNKDKGGPDERYGVDETWDGMGWRERHALICRGITEAARITRRYVLVKCQDQVNSGHVRWQVDEFTAHAATVGLRKVDQFAMLGGRAQPSGRSQQHARRNCSTLLVFERTAKPTNQGSLL